MKENFEVDINKLTEEEKKKFLELVEKAKAETISKPIGKRWRGKWGDVYYTVTSEGHLVDDTENEGFNDEQSYRLGNYFKTEEEADFAREKQFVYQQLSDYALEHNTEEIDWDNNYSDKIFIGYSYKRNELLIRSMRTVKYPNTVYFTSEKIVKDAIKEIGEKVIKYYLFGVED